MELTINDEGVLVDADGNPFEIEGDTVTVSGAVSQSTLDKTIKTRLKKERDRMKTLESQAERTPELERMLEEQKSLVTELEKKAQEAEHEAQQKVSSQIEKTRKQNEELQKALESERTSHVRTQVTNSILAKVGDRFINPGEDVVPRLLNSHRREPKLDAQGNPIEGQFEDVFSVRVPSKETEGQFETADLPVEEALEAIASDPNYTHYLRASNRQGSGVGGSQGKSTVSKRSELKTIAEKTAFVAEHGQEAFEALED